jgi:hypothetical protein
MKTRRESPSIRMVARFGGCPKKPVMEECVYVRPTTNAQYHVVRRLNGEARRIHVSLFDEKWQRWLAVNPQPNGRF